MFSAITRGELVMGSTFGAMGMVAFTSEHLTLIASVGACVGAVVGAVAWIDKRIEARIKLYHFQNEASHREIRGEIGHIKDLLTITGAIPALTPQPPAEG